MSDAVQIAIITALSTAVPLMLLHFLTFRVLKKDVKTIEVATNSIKDALIISTEKEAFARGLKVGMESGYIAGVTQEKANPTK